MTRIGRQLSIGKTDNTSDQRTPRKRLRLIPTDVRESFVPVIPARAVQRQNEWDLTRIAQTVRAPRISDRSKRNGPQ